MGEGGAGVELSTQERNTAAFQQLYRENGFHAFISENISVHRSIKDIRHPEYINTFDASYNVDLLFFSCKKKLYLAELPSVNHFILSESIQ